MLPDDNTPRDDRPMTTDQPRRLSDADLQVWIANADHWPPNDFLTVQVDRMPEIALRRELLQLRKLARDVAATSPVYLDAYQDAVCCYCGSGDMEFGWRDSPEKHDTSCPYRRAVELTRDQAGTGA